MHRYTPEFVACLSEVAQYIHDTYGKFPATLPSIYARLYAQAQHMDLDFYDEHFGPGAYLPTHIDHQKCWHGSRNVVNLPEKKSSANFSAIQGCKVMLDWQIEVAFRGAPFGPIDILARTVLYKFVAVELLGAF